MQVISYVELIAEERNITSVVTLAKAGGGSSGEMNL